MKIVDKKYAKREANREIFRQEAITSYQHYQQTGHYVTGGEVIEWLNSWDSDKVLPAPIPHK